MNRFQIVLTVCVFTAAAAWGQAANSSTSQTPQPGSSAQAQPAQPGQPATSTTGSAPQTSASSGSSGKSEISGCMTRGFANYQLSDSGTQAKYQIRGNGAELDQHANKVVQIQGVPDPKDSQGGKTIFYASSVKDSGQSCGSPDQMAANNAQAQPGAANQNGATTQAQAGSTAQPQPGASAQNQPGASAASSSETAQNAALSGVSNSQPTAGTPSTPAGSSTGSIAAGQPSTSASTSSTMANSSQSTAATQQGGTSGAAAGATQSATSEDKGTPQAGTPQSSAVGAPSGSSSTTGAASSPSSAANQTFQGCVSGDPNNLNFNSNGKDYHLQGDTRSVWKLIGHQVEVTGEDFGGKAIQINGAAKDLGSCKK